MKEFFDRLYYGIYFGSLENGKGELFAILFISFCQTANVVTLLNAFFKVSELYSFYEIKSYFFTLLAIAIIRNSYHYEIKKNRQKIMATRKFDPEDNIAWQYLLFSIFGIFFSSMIYTEF